MLFRSINIFLKRFPVTIRGLSSVDSTDTTGADDFAYGAVHLNSADYVHTVTRTDKSVIHFAFVSLTSENA